MEKCKNWFNDLSLFKKIVLIVFIIIFCTFLIFFLNLQFLIKQYEKELRPGPESCLCIHRK